MHALQTKVVERSIKQTLSAYLVRSQSAPNHLPYVNVVAAREDLFHHEGPNKRWSGSCFPSICPLVLPSIMKHKRRNPLARWKHKQASNLYMQLTTKVNEKKNTLSFFFCFVLFALDMQRAKNNFLTLLWWVRLQHTSRNSDSVSGQEMTRLDVLQTYFKLHHLVGFRSSTIKHN